MDEYSHHRKIIMVAYRMYSLCSSWVIIDAEMVITSCVFYQLHIKIPDLLHLYLVGRVPLNHIIFTKKKS